MSEEIKESETQMEVSPDASTDSKSFQDRLSEIPAYTMTLLQLQSMYTTLKERNEVLKKAFTAGEDYAEKLAAVAKPVVVAATASALKAAKPVVGEVEDPGEFLTVQFVLLSFFENYSP